MGHPQPPTPLITNNNTAHGLTTGRLIPKRSKVVDMCFHWLKYQEAQKQFNIKWKQGTVNRADCHSKHRHPIAHQQRCVQYVVNAAVTAENEDVVANIRNVMHCMCAVVLSQVSAQGCAEALLGIPKGDTWVGANTTAWTTAKPGSLPNARMCTQHT
eukprot:4640237-Ditylum_brightwellii.AAC.1